MPSLWPQIRNDLWSFFLALAIALSWAVLLAVWVALGLGGSWPERGQILEILAAVGLFSLSCGALLVGRTARVRSLFARGVSVEGRIEPGSFEPEGVSRLRYCFDWHGRQARKTAWVIENEQTRRVLRGPGVRVLVDPERPQRSCLRDLFLPWSRTMKDECSE